MTSKSNDKVKEKEKEKKKSRLDTTKRVERMFKYYD